MRIKPLQLTAAVGGVRRPWPAAVGSGGGTRRRRPVGARVVHARPQLSRDPLDRAANERDDQERRLLIALEPAKSGCLLSQQARDRRRASVAYLQPNHLGRCAFEKAPLSEVLVLRDDDEVIGTGVFPDSPVRGTSETHVAYMRAVRVLIPNEPD